MEKTESKISMTSDEYTKYVEEKSVKSPLFKNIVFAFIVGGIICCIGQLICNICMFYEIPKTEASLISTIILIFIGAFLTSINVYSKIGKYAGAGSVVPITGFSNSVVAPAIEFKTEGFILGLGSNMFKVAGPVLVYGIFTSFIIGIIYYLMGIVG